MFEYLFATANATTETDHLISSVEGFRVDSVKRGVYETDYMACINGDRKRWGAGKTRQEAIDSAVSNAKSHEEYRD